MILEDFIEKYKNTLFQAEVVVSGKRDKIRHLRKIRFVNCTIEPNVYGNIITFYGVVKINNQLLKVQSSETTLLDLNQYGFKFNQKTYYIVE